MNSEFICLTMRLQIEMKVDSLDIYCMHVCLKVDRVSIVLDESNM